MAQLKHADHKQEQQEQTFDSLEIGEQLRNQGGSNSAPPTFCACSSPDSFMTYGDAATEWHSSAEYYSWYYSHRPLDHRLPPPSFQLQWSAASAEEQDSGLEGLVASISDRPNQSCSGLPDLDLGYRASSGTALEIVVVNDDTLPSTRAVVEGELSDARIVALDCEGVNLSRAGEISLVQLATSSCCFLFDVDHASARDPVAMVLKRYLEDVSLVKVMHDCKQDSDALLFHLGIKLCNVHDTQAWHVVLFGGRPRNLDDTLLAYNLPPNMARDENVYRFNYRFWATRPLTQHMIWWACSNVVGLLPLHTHQVACAGSRAPEGRAASEGELRRLRDATEYAEVVIHPAQVGAFVGVAGSNIGRLERETGTRLYCHSEPTPLVTVYGDVGPVARALQQVAPYTEPPHPF